jgi:hypothetical protein
LLIDSERLRLQFGDFDEDSQLTSPLHTDRIKLVDVSERLLAAGERGRCAAHISGCGGSLKATCWCSELSWLEVDDRAIAFSKP